MKRFTTNLVASITDKAMFEKMCLAVLFQGQELVSPSILSSQLSLNVVALGNEECSLAQV